MELTSFVFPSSPSTYSYADYYGKLLFIPRAKIVEGYSNFSVSDIPDKNCTHIPCLYLPCMTGSSKLLIFFHGNAEDMTNSEDLAEYLRDRLGVHVLCVEYPSYGIYPGEPSAERLNEDAINIFDYFAKECDWQEENIILMGRSIGSSPAVFVSSCRKPCAMVLISAYTSLRNAVKSIAGKLFQYAVKDSFNNAELIKKTKCPIFLLHGIKDTLVPYSHSQELLAACEDAPCFINLSESMDHQSFDYKKDLADPFRKFAEKCGINFKQEKGKDRFIKIPQKLYFLPANYPKVEPPGFVKKLIMKLK